MNKILIGLLLISQSSFGKIDKSMCEVDNKNIIKRITPKNGKPNYFFKTSPDGRYIYYITGNKNYKLDTLTGEELLIPGSADPVPSRDGRLMSSINWRVSGTQDWSLNLMPMKDGDIFRVGKKPDYSKGVLDTNTKRTYQSVGDLDNGAYRLISMDESVKPSRLLIRDYRVDKAGNISSDQNQDLKIEMDKFKLPMISKSGKEFGVLDYEKNQTVIYEIAEDGKSIKEVDRLDYASGKVDFSDDGKKITFHVTEVVNKFQASLVSNEALMPAVFSDEAEVRNVFVYDRETKAVTPVTQNKSGNSYFPVFLENGNVVYLDQRKGQPLSFVVSKVPNVAPRSLTRAESCFEGEEFDTGLNELAGLWRKVCTDWEGSEKGSTKVMMLNLPYDFCIQIAKSSKDNSSELLKVCKALKDSEIKKPAIAKKNKTQKMLQTKCAICHGDNIPFGDKSKLKSYKDEILKRVNSDDPSYRMPLGGSLSNEEKSELKDYLESL